jgi:predicted negative regulator of RcsB-dependent stress response
MKRVERRQLKEDEFVSGMTWFLDLMKTWKRELLIGLGVLVLLALVFLGITFLKNQGLKAESRIFGEIISLREGLDAKPENLPRLEKLAGPGQYARVAYVALATYWLEKGDLDKAEKNASAVKASRRDFIAYEAQDLLAQILVRKKDFGRALEIYARIEKEKPSSYPLDAILFHKAEALELKGDVREAVAAYKKLQEDYNQTYYGYEASLKVGRLESAK